MRGHLQHPTAFPFEDHSPPKATLHDIHKPWSATFYDFGDVLSWWLSLGHRLITWPTYVWWHARSPETRHGLQKKTNKREGEIKEDSVEESKSFWQRREVINFIEQAINGVQRIQVECLTLRDQAWTSTLSRSMLLSGMSAVATELSTCQIQFSAQTLNCKLGIRNLFLLHVWRK